MNILVNGLGNIGTTLANVLLEFKDLLGLKNVYIFKNQPTPWLTPDLELLTARGAILVESLSDVWPKIDYLFDCRAMVDDLDQHLALAPQLQGVCLQGGAVGQGSLFMVGLSQLAAPPPQIIRVASCNTHSIAALLQFFGGPDLANILEADFVVVRRSEDLSDQEKLVGSNVVVRHPDPTLGTHHAVDVQALFKHLPEPLQITTSDITTPSQLLHALRFNLTLKNPIRVHDLTPTDSVAFTQKFDSNKVFELGRRYGFQGRIYSQSILVTTSLLEGAQSIKGWAFAPQEGNTIISSIEAFLIQTNASERALKINHLKQDLLIKNL